MCIYFLVNFAIPNSNWTLLFVKLENSTMGDLIDLKGKGELPTSWDYGIARYFHLLSNDH